jgi:hypothetical protein
MGTRKRKDEEPTRAGPHFDIEWESTMGCAGGAHMGVNVKHDRLMSHGESCGPYAGGRGKDDGRRAELLCELCAVCGR